MKTAVTWIDLRHVATFALIVVYLADVIWRHAVGEHLPAVAAFTLLAMVVYVTASIMSRREEENARGTMTKEKSHGRSVDTPADPAAGVRGDLLGD